MREEISPHLHQSKKVHAVFRSAGDCPRALAEACVPDGDRTTVLWLQRRLGRSVCQSFSLDAMNMSPERVLPSAWPDGVPELARDHTRDRGDWSAAADSCLYRGSHGGGGTTFPSNACWCHTLVYYCQIQKRALVA